MSSQVAAQDSRRRGWKLGVTLALGWGGRHLRGLSAAALALALIVYALIWLDASVLCSVISETRQRGGGETAAAFLPLQFH